MASDFITVTMTLTEAQKKALDESYENGAYIQGYVFAVPEATAEGLKQVSHSIPVLSFFGDVRRHIGGFLRLHRFGRITDRSLRLSLL